MWLIGGLLAGAVVLSLARQRPRGDGEELLRAMEEKTPLRTALMVFDYHPEADPSETRPSGSVGENSKFEIRNLNQVPNSNVPMAENSEPRSSVGNVVRRGTGALPGGLQADASQHWMVWREAGGGGEFTWRWVKTGENPLRQALAGESQKRVTRALRRMGYYEDAVRGAIRSAMAELDDMTDEMLFMAWVRADRAVMAETEKLTRAVREGLLLVARENGGPVVVFEVQGQVIYLLPVDGSEAGKNEADTWVTLEAFRDGRMAWRGTLRLLRHPTPATVQAIATRVAREPAMNRKEE